MLSISNYIAQDYMTLTETLPVWDCQTLIHDRMAYSFIHDLVVVVMTLYDDFARFVSIIALKVITRFWSHVINTPKSKLMWRENKTVNKTWYCVVCNVNMHGWTLMRIKKHKQLLRLNQPWCVVGANFFR